METWTSNSWWFNFDPGDILEITQAGNQIQVFEKTRRFTLRDAFVLPPPFRDDLEDGTIGQGDS